MQLHFIVGTGRCGSSLLQELLSCHPDVGFVSNVDDFLAPLFRSKGRFNNAAYALTGTAWTRKGSVRFAPSEAYRIISRCVSPIYADSHRDLTSKDVTPWLASGFRDFFGSRIRVQGKPQFLHKYTGWSRAGFFSEIFPESRFVHVVRDGRAVANSWLQTSWWNGYRGPEHWRWGPLRQGIAEEWANSGESYVALAGIGWRVLMDSYVMASSLLPQSKFLEIKYEEFLVRPAVEMRRVTDFLGLAPSNRLDKAVTSAGLDITRGDAYQHELSAGQIRLLEESLGGMLARYGYK